MYSNFTKSSSGRLGSVGTSVFVHALVVGLLLLLGGPVWESGRPRSVTKLTLPAPLVPRTLSPVIRQSPVNQSPVKLPPAPIEPEVARATASLPRPRPLAAPVRHAPMRIEAPPEVAPVAATMPPPMSMPKLAVRPAVQVGLLEAATVPAPATPVRALSGKSGFDVGTVDTRAETSAGRRVAGAGFGESSAASPAAARRAFSPGGFDQLESAAARPAANVASTPFEGIEILEKPLPVYTEEARRLRIEGTVQLRVVFGAAGQIRVVGVLKGLGHGLDEAAVQAAEAIRFRPARRDGRPVDAPAVIQIQFQIA